MPESDLSKIPDGPAVWPSDRNVNDVSHTLTEIKRISYWGNHAEIRKRDQEVFVAFHRADVTNGGGTINLHLQNPDGSGVSFDCKR